MNFASCWATFKFLLASASKATRTVSAPNSFKTATAGFQALTPARPRVKMPLRAVAMLALSAPSVTRTVLWEATGILGILGTWRGRPGDGPPRVFVETQQYFPLPVALSTRTFNATHCFL